MNTLWYVLIILLIIFGFIISKFIKFDNYKIFNMIKCFDKKSKTGLFLSLGTKMGVGSIIGTTISIYIGGPGSVLWIIIFCLLTSSLVYYECYTGNRYKVKNKDGSFTGGPFFYILNGLKNKPLAYIFLILLIICYSFFFQMIQTNTITNLITLNFNVNIYLITLIFFLLTFLLIFFSIKELLNTMNKLVPIMCLIYIILGSIILIINFKDINIIIEKIFLTAFTKRGFLVGALVGIKRSIFLNEIMIGTSSISSSVDDVIPEISAKIGTLGVYFITFIISILTSFLILIFKENNIFYISNYNELISSAFKYHFGDIGIFLLIIIIFLFAVTTIISGVYIGVSNLEIITKNKKAILIFKTIMLLFCMSGIFINVDIIWQMIDYIMFILILINVYSLYKIYKEKK